MRHLRIEPPRLDDLLSALRRHDRGDSLRLLDDWAAEEQLAPHGEDDDPDWVETERSLDDPLTEWVHREAVLHVAGGRFEHALCLVEAYRRPISAAEKAERNRLPEPEPV